MLTGKLKIKVHSKNPSLSVDLPFCNTRENNNWSRPPSGKGNFLSIGRILWNLNQYYHCLSSIEQWVDWQATTDVERNLKVPSQKIYILGRYFTNCSTWTANGSERRFRFFRSRINIWLRKLFARSIIFILTYSQSSLFRL